MSRRAQKVHAPSTDDSGQPLCGTWADYPRIAKTTKQITCQKCLNKLPRKPQRPISERTGEPLPLPEEKKSTSKKKGKRQKPWLFKPVSPEKRAAQTPGSLWLGHALHNIGGSLWLDDATVW